VDIPLSANALAHLPEQGAGEYVFKLPMTWVVEKYLNMWRKSAEIEKHITYHCSRHTHATLLLTYGVDIYTVSKLLGHTQIKTTEIYADIINEKKMAAVDLIPTL
jgi:site-specific recombinase XerD